MKKSYQESNSGLRENSKFKILIWSLFDFANTSFSIIVVTFIFAVYFKEVVTKGNSAGDFYWGLAISISMIITAIISPVLGAISDYSTGKKGFLLFFTTLCIIGTASLFFVGEGDIFLAIVLFVLANIGFEAGLVFYDAFLPEIAEPKNYGKVSGYGYAFGYFGSLASLGIAFPFINNDMIRETFPISAIFFMVFALPLFLLLKEKKKRREVKESYFKIGFGRVKNTLTHLKNYKNLATFLAAFFIYIEGVNTVIFFSGIYASQTLQFSMTELIIFFIIVQSTAIIGALLFGFISDKRGQKKAIVYSLYIWIFTVVVAYFSSADDAIIVTLLAKPLGLESLEFQKDAFYFIGLLAGSVMGATQATSRSLMSRLTPYEQKTEFFGFYSFFGKSSAIVGPLAFGAISSLVSQRVAILSVAFFFIAGLVVLNFVKEPAR